MPFNEKLPEWNNSGVEPPQSKKDTGFEPGEKPPAQWFNWLLNRVYLALKELREKTVEKVEGKQLSDENYTAEEKQKLGGLPNQVTKVESSTNNGNIKIDDIEIEVYKHPSAHPASIITESSTKRFVTDTEKTIWNAKETTTGAQEKVDTHGNLTNPHGATSAATANRLILRDALGRAKVAAPSANDDIARKAEVDAVQTNLINHIGAIDPHTQYALDTELASHMADKASHGAGEFDEYLTYDENGNLQSYEIKDNDTTIYTSNITRDVDGNITGEIETLSGKTITSTINRIDGKIQSITKVVS